MDNNHQKHETIAIVLNVGISEDDENILGEKKTNEEVLEMVDEQLYIIPTIKKRKITYFGHMIRRNNIPGLILEGPLEGKVSRGGPRTEWMTNITEWTGMRYEQLVRLAQDREQWRVMTANLLQEDGT